MNVCPVPVHECVGVCVHECAARTNKHHFGGVFTPVTTIVQSTDAPTLFRSIVDKIINKKMQTKTTKQKCRQ